jgi:SagB-type dehydrogenase family enzyme
MNKRHGFVLSDDELHTLWEEYHVASRNQGGNKHLVNEHLVHYGDLAQRLARNAPLRFTERPKVSLPVAVGKAEMPVEEAITRRVSGRAFGSEPLSLDELAALLYLGNGIRRANGNVEYKVQRNAPNSGNLGSVELFPIVSHVSGVEPGLYHYDTVSHELALLAAGRFATWLREFVLFQLEFAEAPVALVMTSAIGRLSAKYGMRAYRMAILDVGHVSENLQLAATAMGLQVCATAGFIDDELDGALGLDGCDIASILVVLVGPRFGN